MKTRRTGKISIILIGLFFVFMGIAAWIENTSFEEYEADEFWNRVAFSISSNIMYDVFPVMGYAGEGMWDERQTAAFEIFMDEMPLYAYLQEELYLKSIYEDEETFLTLSAADIEESALYQETENGIVEESEYYEEMINENHHAVMFVENSDFFTGGSGFISEISTAWVTEFVKAGEKTVDYEEDKLSDYEFAMENFYTIDSCTSAGPEMFRPEELLAFDTTIDKTAPGPHILIYHTHSQETFADSVPGDKSTTILGAGAKLAELLREEYGYEVYHHTGEYDIDTRDDAYAEAAPALEEILEQYPQIQVIIDLHRDGVDESRHLVAEWQGRQVAQFMFFNGLSYLNTKGTIDYLPNPNLTGNLATSYQATIIANEYYPGLARRTYLNGYRYNMHYREKTLLIELGAQTNTVDEIMSACEPLAHVLDMVFSDEENE